MYPQKIKCKEGPEAAIQADIVKFLRYRGWFVKETHGNLYSHGWPDLYATHSTYRSRWIEVKNLESYSFTAAQLDAFPKFCANGSPIWILVAATEEEYRKLWLPSNWYFYLMLLNQRGCK